MNMTALPPATAHGKLGKSAQKRDLQTPSALTLNRSASAASTPAVAVIAMPSVTSSTFGTTLKDIRLCSWCALASPRGDNHVDQFRGPIPEKPCCPTGYNLPGRRDGPGKRFQHEPDTDTQRWQRRSPQRARRDGQRNGAWRGVRLNLRAARLPAHTGRASLDNLTVSRCAACRFARPSRALLCSGNPGT